MPPTTHQSSPEHGQSFVGPVDAQATLVTKPHERAHGLRLGARGLKLVVKWSILIGMGTAMAIAGGTVGEVIGGAVLAFGVGRTIRRMAGPRWHEYRSRH